LYVIVLLIFSKWGRIPTKNMQMSILFMDPVVAVWQQPLKNAKGALQICILLFCKCRHALQGKGEFPNPIGGHPVQQTIDRNRSYSRWWTVFQALVFVEHAAEPHAIIEGMENS
jgi:hypothetical protein